MKILATLVILATMLMTTACPHGVQGLATASDATAHALANAQSAARQAEATGVISHDDERAFEAYLVRASETGLELDNAIRAGANAQTVSEKTNVFLDAFNALNTSGLAGIKNPALQLSISTILTGAETSIAIIAASVGGGK